MTLLTAAFSCVLPTRHKISTSPRFPHSRPRDSPTPPRDPRGRGRERGPEMGRELERVQDAPRGKETPTAPSSRFPRLQALPCPLPGARALLFSSAAGRSPPGRLPAARACARSSWRPTGRSPGSRRPAGPAHWAEPARRTGPAHLAVPPTGQAPPSRPGPGPSPGVTSCSNPGAPRMRPRDSGCGGRAKCLFAKEEYRGPWV